MSSTAEKFIIIQLNFYSKSNQWKCYLAHFKMLQSRPSVHDVVRCSIATVQPIFSFYLHGVSWGEVRWLDTREAVTNALCFWYHQLLGPFRERDSTNEVLEETINQLFMSIFFNYWAFVPVICSVFLRGVDSLAVFAGVHVSDVASRLPRAVKRLNIDN